MPERKLIKYFWGKVADMAAEFDVNIAETCKGDRFAAVWETGDLDGGFNEPPTEAEIQDALEHSFVAGYDGVQYIRI